MKDRITLGKIVKMLRAYNNDTLRSCASKVEISHAHLCNIEKGKIGCSMRLVGKMEEVYGYNPYVLMWMINEYDNHEYDNHEYDYKELIKNLFVND